MPDQTVQVTFDPAANPQFTFDQESVTMTEASKVILQRKPGNAQWDFVTAVVKGDTLNEFSATLPGQSGVLHINDAFRDTARTAYSYNVTVTLNAVETTSPDPEIVNDPGGGVA